ncbi:hypothetical protein QF037_006636 [Streptomyces canus]|nr:hypothetical protein [Streptomyces canus]
MARKRRSSLSRALSAVSSDSAVLEAVGADHRRSLAGGEQPGQHPALDVVEHIARPADVGLLVPGHPAQHPVAHEQPYHRRQIQPLLASLQRELDPRGGQLGIGGVQDHLLGEPAERDLRLAPLQRGQRQAQQHIAAAGEGGAGAGGLAGRMGGVGQGARCPAQPGSLRVHPQRPARVAVEPVAQVAGVAAYQAELLGVRAVRQQQRLLQQGAGGLVELGGAPAVQHLAQGCGHRSPPVGMPSART